VNKDHWPLYARHWELLGPPLRPSPEDSAAVRAAVAAWRAEHPGARLRALVLGVTPELAVLPWPPETTVLAVDRAEAMIGALWAGAGDVAAATAVCGDWRALPCEDGTLDVVVGDGCFTTLGFPHDYRAVVNEVRRVLSPGGRLVMRFFVPPAVPEELQSIADDLHAGRIAGFHAFKWRLVTALHSRSPEGTTLGAIWDAWHAMCPDPAALSAKLGWSLDVITSIDAYRGTDTTYSFPTLEETRALVGESFTELSCHVPTYELGDRFPTLVWQVR
jgi:SAM-dependent methyltransferase